MTPPTNETDPRTTEFRRDPERRAIVETRSGDFLTQKLHDRDRFAYSFLLQTRDEAPIVEVVFEWDQRQAVAGNDSRRIVTLTFVEAYDYVRADRATPIPATHPLVTRACRFVEAIYRSSSDVEIIVHFIGTEESGDSADVQ